MHIGCDRDRLFGIVELRRLVLEATAARGRGRQACGGGAFGASTTFGRSASPPGALGLGSGAGEGRIGGGSVLSLRCTSARARAAAPVGDAKNLRRSLTTL
jgi:hypothetical protein